MNETQEAEARAVAERLVPYLSLARDQGWPGVEESEREGFADAFAKVLEALGNPDLGWRSLTIRSRRHGVFHVLLDSEDYERVVARGRWHIKPHRGSYYAKKTDYQHGNASSLYMHNFILGCKGLDHINGDGLDNRRRNLRLASPAENAQNKGLAHDNKSGFRGVSWAPCYGKWSARVKCKGKTHYLGYFDDPKEAAECARLGRAHLFTHANEDRHKGPARD